MSHLSCPRGQRIGVSKNRSCNLVKDCKKSCKAPHHREHQMMEKQVEHTFVARLDEVLFREHGGASLPSRLPNSPWPAPRTHTGCPLEQPRRDEEGSHDVMSLISFQQHQQTAVGSGLTSPLSSVDLDRSDQETSCSAEVPECSTVHQEGLQHARHPALAGDVANEDLYRFYPSLVRQLDGLDQYMSDANDEGRQGSGVGHQASSNHEDFDVATFLGQWCKVSSGNRASQWLRSDYPASTRPNTVDMQRLDWDEIGAERSEALHGRYLLHPERQRLPGHPPPIDAAETVYRFRKYTSMPLATPSHHQLRHILASSGRSNIFYSSAGKVMRASLTCPDHQETVLDLSPSNITPGGIRITCIATSPNTDYHSDGILLAGGFNGEFALLNLHGQEGRPVQGFVSHAYNSVVTNITTNHDRRSGLLQANFCSNDRNIRVMDVTTSRFIATHSFEHAINCSALSADGRLQVVVGDHVDALIVDAETGVTQTTLTGHDNDIFACAWSPDGRNVATGAEDGLVMVWDARSWKTPVETQKCLMATPRLLEFTDDSSLVAAEDDDVVSVYGPGMYERQQAIWFFGSVAGMTLVSGGDEVVVADADETVGGLLSFSRVHWQEKGEQKGWSAGREGFDVIV